MGPVSGRPLLDPRIDHFLLMALLWSEHGPIYRYFRVSDPKYRSPLARLSELKLSDYVGFDTGNGEKLSYSQAAGLAWLCLAVT